MMKMKVTKHFTDMKYDVNIPKQVSAWFMYEQFVVKIFAKSVEQGKFVPNFEHGK